VLLLLLLLLVITLDQTLQTHAGQRNCEPNKEVG
jgi:hypothetical protein